MEIAVLILAALIAVGGAVAGVVWGRRRAERALAEMERDYARRAEQVDADADARVQRLRREADAIQTRQEVRLAADLLPALDALRQAAVTECADGAEVARGVQLVLRQAEEVFARHDVEKVEPEPGDAFDRTLHEAIDVVEAEASGEVATCRRVGWRRGDRVLRPAMVVVTRAPEATVKVPEDVPEDVPAGEGGAPGQGSQDEGKIVDTP